MIQKQLLTDSEKDLWTESTRKLSKNVLNLGAYEVQLLAELAQRWLDGQEKFGKVYTDKRDWKKNLYEECQDAIFYAGMQIIKDRETGSKAG